jgi:energy-converting hydrogenase Eha subunit F
MTHIFDKAVVWQAGSSGNFIFSQLLPESEVMYAEQANEYKIKNNYKHFLNISKTIEPQQRLLAAHPFPTQWLKDNDVYVNDMICIKPSWWTEILLYTKRMMQFRISPNDLVWMIKEAYYLADKKDIDWHNFKDVGFLIRITERINEEFNLDVGNIQQQVTLCVLYMVWLKAQGLSDSNENLATFIQNQIINHSLKEHRHLDHAPYDKAKIDLENTGKVGNVFVPTYEDMFIDCTETFGLDKRAIQAYSLKNVDLITKICNIGQRPDLVDRVNEYKDRIINSYE